MVRKVNIWYLLAGLLAAFALVVVSKIVQLALTDPGERQDIRLRF